MTKPSKLLERHISTLPVQEEPVHDAHVFPEAREWSFIVDPPRTPRWNMALDRAILHSVARGQSGPTLRFYRWSKPAVTLGFHQKMERVLDILAVRKAGIEVVVRPTGGRAVLHGDDLTYSIALPEEAASAYGITELYKILSEALQTGFRQAGIEVELARGNRGDLRPGAQPCFASTARYELVVGGKKIVGSAQRRHKGGILQQGSIPLRRGRFYPEELAPRRLRDGFKSSRWTTVEEVLGRPLEFETLANALATGFSTRLNVSMTPRQPTPLELEEAAILVEQNK